MPITDYQREHRNRHIGGSDVPAIMGASPWATAWDVWAEKRGLTEPREANPQMEAGTHFEDGVLEWAEKHLGKVLRNQYRSHPPAYLGCHIDALAVEDNNRPVEVKTGGLFGPLLGDWGEAGTGDVPDHVILQAHAHMIVTDADLCHVAAFLGGRGFRLYEVQRDDQLAAMVVERCIMFWERNVIGGIEPDEQPSLDVAKRLKRTPNKMITLNPELWERYKADAILLKAQEQRVDNIKAEILAAMGDAEAAVFPGTGQMLTYMEQTQNRKAQEAKVITFRKWQEKTVKD